MKVHDVAARGFGSAADVYERARPSYAPDAVSWLCDRLSIGAGRTVLDLAAGTGKLTRDLVPTGAEVIAVEPLDEMRAHLVAALPGVQALSGMAEAIPLGDESVDAVLCAQAFHWFRTERAIPEIHRVLRPGGGLGLLWNTRDLGDDLQRRIDEILAGVRGAASQHWNDNADDALGASPLFGDVEHRTWPGEQRLTPEGLLEVVASRSYVASLDEARRNELLEEVRREIEGKPEPIVLRYVVEVFVTDRQ